MACEISLAVNWMSGRSRARYKHLMQLLRNSTRRFSSKKGPASGCRARKFALSQGIGLPLLDTLSPCAAKSRSAWPLIRFVREHLRTPWFRWMIRDDSVQNSDLMQTVGTQDSSILNDESFRQFRFVAVQVTTHSEPNVIIARAQSKAGICYDGRRRMY